MTWPRLVFLAVTLFRWVKYYFLCCLSLSNLSSSLRFFFFFLLAMVSLQCGNWSSIRGTFVMIFVWCGWSGGCVWCLNILGALKFDVWMNFIFWTYINEMLLPLFLLFIPAAAGFKLSEGRGKLICWTVFLQNFVACWWCFRGWEMHIFYFLWAIILIGLNLEGACCWPNVCQW